MYISQFNTRLLLRHRVLLRFLSRLCLLNRLRRIKIRLRITHQQLRFLMRRHILEQRFVVLLDPLRLFLQVQLLHLH